MSQDVDTLKMHLGVGLNLELIVIWQRYLDTDKGVVVLCPKCVFWIWIVWMKGKWKLLLARYDSDRDIPRK